MVSYMWGKDVADALDAKQGLPADPNDEYDFDVSAADIYKSIDRRIDRLYRMAAGLPLDNPQTTL